MRIPEAPLPEHIGPYKIEGVLDRGGMSELYLAIHPISGDPAAIKVLSFKYLSHPQLVKRFLKEAEIIAMADHPNVVRLYGYGEWEGGLYIAMEFVQGLSLRKYLMQSPPSLKRALGIVIDIAYALCHLHTYGIIHRDLKPENILLSEEGAIKLIDFGIAQLLQEEISEEQFGLIGTPVYMSPEQMSNPHNVGFTSDIYSLGIIAYELILGRFSMGQIQLALMPKGMQKILTKTLQANPTERYQDVVDLITDLSGYLYSPAIEKEKGAGDHLSELADEFMQVSKMLSPPPPEWPNVECGIIVHQLSILASGFYLFLPSAVGTEILMGASSEIGMRGGFFTSSLCGMARALHLTHGGDFRAWLPEFNRLLQLTGNLSFFASLNLQPTTDHFLYTSYGYGTLLYLRKDAHQFEIIHPLESSLLGSSDDPNLQRIEHPWKVGDTLIWWGHYPLNGDEGYFWREKWSVEPFLEHPGASIQKRLEAFYRRMRAHCAPLWHKEPFTLICLHRN